MDDLQFFQHSFHAGDLVGLRINGYLDGKPYYGKVFYENGFKYAGVSNALGAKIAIYNTKQESIRQQSNQFLISEAIISQVQSNQTTSTLNNNDSTTIYHFNYTSTWYQVIRSYSFQ